MTTTDFELQQARMAVVHVGRDDLFLAKAALLSRSDMLLNDRKGLLAEMRDFVEFARADGRPTSFHAVARDEMPPAFALTGSLRSTP